MTTPARWSSVLLALVPILGCAPEPAVEPTRVFASDIELLAFDNGMRAVVARLPDDSTRPPRVYIGLYIGYGTASESGPELAHLVEHVAANNRPSIVDYTVPDSITYYGSNAMTRPDYTSLWRAVAPEGLPAHLRTRANRVAGVNNDPAVFGREVGRVAGELTRAAESRAEHGWSAADALAAAFRKDADDDRFAALRSYTAERVAAEIRAYYRPGNAVLVVAGNLDMARTLDEVRSVLAAYPSRAGPDPVVAPPFPANGSPVVLPDPRAAHTRVGLGFEAPDRAAFEEFLAFLVFDQWLLGGRSGTDPDEEFARDADAPLGRHLQTRLGIDAIDDGRAYQFGPPRLAFRSPTYLGAHFEVSGNPHPDSIILHAREAYREAVRDDLTDSAVVVARIELVRFLETWMQKTDLLSLGDMLAALTMIDGDPALLRSLPERIRRVSRNRVRELADRYATGTGMRIGIVHPPR